MLTKYFWGNPVSFFSRVSVCQSVTFSTFAVAGKLLPFFTLKRRPRWDIREDFGDARVTKVEKSVFESRMSGYPRKYRLFFEKPEIGMQHVIYDNNGKRAGGFDFWFEEK